MAKKKRSQPDAKPAKGSGFARAREVARLRRQGDPRWKKAAKTDLEELAKDDEGIRLLAAAISALLRE